MSCNFSMCLNQGYSRIACLKRAKQSVNHLGVKAVFMNMRLLRFRKEEAGIRAFGVAVKALLEMVVSHALSPGSSTSHWASC